MPAESAHQKASLQGHGKAARSRGVRPPFGLEGILSIPPTPRGLVIFAHGSGSSRLSPRNAHVAEILNNRGIATLLLDLLTEDEETQRTNVFDIPLLADRLGAAVRYARSSADVGSLPIGLFGASTGAAAALATAAERTADIDAVVSRGGRPDLAGDALAYVRAPTLLIVGGADDRVLYLNREALTRIRSEKALTVVPDATHLFEEPGALDKVADAAADWFDRAFGARLSRSAERHPRT